VPIDVTDDEPKLSTEEKRQQELAGLQQSYRRVYGTPLPKEIVSAFNNKAQVEDGEERLKEHQGVEKLTEAQRMAVRLHVAESIPAVRPFLNDWQKLYADSLGDPLDFPHGEDDLPNGAMHKLRLSFESRVLGYAYLSNVERDLRKFSEAQIAGANG
jgi:hypothetical protein